MLRSWLIATMCCTIIHMKAADRTKGIIKYLVFSMNLPTITSITKMLYLIDLASVSSTGHKTTNLNFVRYYYGPYDKNIKTILDELTASNEIEADVKYLSNGEPFIAYKSPSNVTDCDYDGENAQIVQDLVNSLGNLSPKTLTELAYKTKPMTKLGATLGGNEHLNEVLDLSEV